MLIIKCIYAIKSKVKPERVYVGSAKHFRERAWRHRNELKQNIHKNKKLQNHVNKYGQDDLYFEVLEMVKDINNLLPREQFYIDSYKPFFNLKPTAGSPIGFKHSEETKEKIRAGNIGRKVSDETKERIRQSAIGRKWSEQQRLKTIETRKGVKRPPFSKEWRENISKAQKGHKNNIKGWITRRNKLKNVA